MIDYTIYTVSKNNGTSIENDDESVEVRSAIAHWHELYFTSISEKGRKTTYPIYKCSICGTTNGRRPSNYCPYCGAKMTNV